MLHFVLWLAYLIGSSNVIKVGGKQKPYEMRQTGISLAASPLAKNDAAVPLAPSRIPPATQAIIWSAEWMLAPLKAIFRYYRHSSSTCIINDKLISAFNVVRWLFYWTDASSATDVNRAIRSPSCPQGCQYTSITTVDLDANITQNCSTTTRGLQPGMTWRQAKKIIQNSTGSPDLVLLHFNSTKDNDTMPCDCSNIHFARRCFFTCFYLSFH